MSRSRIVCALLLVLILGGCKGAADPQSIPDDMMITLERTVCYGSCPDYKLTITASGEVTFEGHEFVRVKGVAKGNLSREKLQALLDRFNSADFFSWNNKYTTTQDGCPEVWTDSPSATTSLRLNGRFKTISHYYGCMGNQGGYIYPKPLTALESQIDSIVGTDQWINETMPPGTEK